MLREDGTLAIYANSNGGRQPVETSASSAEDGFAGTGIAYFAPDGDLLLYKDACSATNTCEGLGSDVTLWSLSKAANPQRAAGKFAQVATAATAA